MEHDPRVIEEHAYSLLSQEKYDEAFRSFIKAAHIFKNQKNHKQAALVFASAAGAWGMRLGEKTFFNSASAYEEAARQAEAGGDFEYAALLYKYAAISYEKDMEFINFSDCFFHSKECQRKFLNYLFSDPKKIHPIAKASKTRTVRGYARQVLHWLTLTFSFIIWGHGERPGRTVLTCILVVLISACLYASGELLSNGIVSKPHALDALYFSVVTFSTVGYGDFTPVGISKVVAVAESLCGLLVVPLLVVGLSRKYLRV